MRLENHELKIERCTPREIERVKTMVVSSLHANIYIYIYIIYLCTQSVTSTEIRVSCIGLRLKSWQKDPHLTAQAADKSHPLLCEGSLRSRPQGLAPQISLH